jgi:hypothetical protein
MLIKHEGERAAAGRALKTLAKAGSPGGRGWQNADLKVQI